MSTAVPAFSHTPRHALAPPFVPSFNSCPPIRVTTLPNGWAVAIVNVTPELAEEMLTRNVDNQRPVRPQVVARYATDMSSGAWRLTHQGIAFNARGELHDGQHRLSAVIASGANITFLVFFGAGGTTEMTVIDTHKIRNVLDASRVLGREATTRQIATLNAMVRYGVTNGNGVINSLTQTERLVLLERHRDVITKVTEWFGAGKIARLVGKAPVVAAVACAAYHIEHDKLSRFVAVLTEQSEPAKGESVATTLRQFVVTSYTKTTPQAAFLKSCRALQHYLSGTEVPSHKLYACADNPFPIPGFAASE